jgi:hypothetical protein
MEESIETRKSVDKKGKRPPILEARNCALPRRRVLEGGGFAVVDVVRLKDSWLEGMPQPDVGRRKDEYAKIRSAMARRPRPPNEMLSRADLAELQRRLSMLSVTAVQDFYHGAHHRCRLEPGYFPPARAVQEFVTVWKQLRKWR